MKAVIGLTAALFAGLAGPVHAVHADEGKIAVVAAENFYGDVARQIGGDRVSVASILSNPDQDPHLFEVSPAVVRATVGAQIIIYNGADYDPWMGKLLKATPMPGRAVIVAADLMHKKAGDNPHLWYDPATMPTVASALAAALSTVDPGGKDGYEARLKTFLASLAPINEKIAALRSKYAGVAVTATEPIFDYMATALELRMHDEQLQLAIMNDTEPSAGDLAAFEDELKAHGVRVLFYNKQASDRLVRHLVDLARVSHISVVAVTETCPPGVSYQDWLLSELDATEKALGGSIS